MDQSSNRSCIPWLLLGFLLFALLALLSNCVGASNHIVMANKALDTAKNGLKNGGFNFATAEINGANIVVKGNAPDKNTKIAACDAALAALKVEKMVGLPGVVRDVTCAINAPGDANTNNVIAQNDGVKPIDNKTADVAAVKNINQCADELLATQKTLKIGYAKSSVDIISGTEALDKIAAIAKTCEKVGKIEIAGHTDTGGEAAMNLKLSQARADKVKQYLVSKGVNPANLIAKGYGESKPLIEDHAVIGVDNPERAINRRTEFTISAQ